MDMSSTSYTGQTSDEVERQIRYEVCQKYVNIEFVKNLTPAKTNEFLLFWMQQVDTAVDPHDGLTGCYAALRIIEIRMRYGKHAEQKKMLQMQVIVNNRRDIFSTALWFDMAIDSTEMMVE